MDFGFFRAASRGSFRLIASNESGAARQIEIPAGRTTRVGALAGETFEVIDPSTGRAVRKLSARRVGRSLYLQLGDAGAATLIVESFFADASEGLDRLQAGTSGDRRLKYLTGDGELVSIESIDGTPQPLSLGVWTPPAATVEAAPPPAPLVVVPATKPAAEGAAADPSPADAPKGALGSYGPLLGALALAGFTKGQI